MPRFVTKEIPRWDSDDVDPMRFKKDRVANGISLWLVLFSINFNGKVRLSAIEVEDVRLEGHLSSEAEP